VTLPSMWQVVGSNLFIKRGDFQIKRAGITIACSFQNNSSLRRTHGDY